MAQTAVTVHVQLSLIHIFGMTVEGVSVDWSEVIGRSRKVSDRLAGGVGFLFKQKTAYEISRSDWSSDVCSSDLLLPPSGPQ